MLEPDWKTDPLPFDPNSPVAGQKSPVSGTTWSGICVKTMCPVLGSRLILALMFSPDRQIEILNLDSEIMFIKVMSGSLPLKPSYLTCQGSVEVSIVTPSPLHSLVVTLVM